MTSYTHSPVQGLIGHKGDDGFTGAGGMPGDSGPKGNQGPQGQQGPEVRTWERSVMITYTVQNNTIKYMDDKSLACKAESHSSEHLASCWKLDVMRRK